VYLRSIRASAQNPRAAGCTAPAHASYDGARLLFELGPYGLAVVETE